MPLAVAEAMGTAVVGVVGVVGAVAAAGGGVGKVERAASHTKDTD